METITISARFAPTPAAVREAREFVLAQATQARVPVPAEVSEDVALLVSELATNAMIHAGTAFRIGVAFNPTVVRVEVEDDNPALPQPRPVDTDATSGRGLLILERLADRWGTTPLTHGKRVWFERGLHRAGRPQPLPA